MFQVACSYCYHILFVDDERILLLLIIGSRQKGTYISTSQFVQISQIIHRQKLANQLTWNGALLRVKVTKTSTVDQWIHYNKKNKKVRKYLAVR